MEANFTWRGPASSVSSFMLNSFSFSKCLMSPGNLPPQSPSGKGLCSATPTLRHYGTNWKTFVQHQSIPGGIPRVMEMECCVQFSELQSFPCAGGQTPAGLITPPDTAERGGEDSPKLQFHLLHVIPRKSPELLCPLGCP